MKLQYPVHHCVPAPDNGTCKGVSITIPSCLSCFHNVTNCVRCTYLPMDLPTYVYLPTSLLAKLSSVLPKHSFESLPGVEELSFNVRLIDRPNKSLNNTPLRNISRRNRSNTVNNERVPIHTISQCHKQILE